jgi:hypothetical protein
VKDQSNNIQLFSFSALLLKGEHSFIPFNQSCIGLSSSKSYKLQFRIKSEFHVLVSRFALSSI